MLKTQLDEKIYELKFKFEVGETEKHIVEFTYNRFWGYVTIKVDNQPYKKRKTFAWLGKTKSFEIKVGNNETHNIRISLVKGISPFVLKEIVARVYIDEELKHNFSGNLSLKSRSFNTLSFRNKTAIILSIIFVIALGVFLITYHLPIKIETKQNGILFRGRYY